MKRITLLALLFLPLFAFATQGISTQDNYYYDGANLLTSSAKQALNSLLNELDQTDGTQIIVYTVKSLNGQNLEETSLKIAESLQIGSKNNDNGVLLFIALEERKIRIEVGQGLEGVLTDLLSSQIIRNEIAPYFQQQDYQGGIINGTLKIIEAVKGEYTASAEEEPSSLISLGFILLFMILFIVFTSKAKKPGDDNDSHRGGGSSAFPLIFFLGGNRGHHYGNSGGSSGFGGFGGFSGGGGGFGGGGASGGW